MDTDKNCSEPRFSAARIRSPDSEPKQHSAGPEFGPQNLCSSVSICGRVALSRVRALTINLSLLSSLAASVAVLCLTGCKPSSSAPADGGKLFGVSFQTLNNPFFVDVNQGLKAVVEARGDRLVTLDAQWNSLKQKNEVADLWGLRRNDGRRIGQH